ncbi:cytochrome b5 domain-containing protein [Bombilactobacillus bombi]|uniref:cytochrome b5 domain-containing protein n=1 Tax=Bombilactobacillus bombi TaxID=1303590 RepID=UPI0015E6152E|nr:cytochrome b5 domain-containing protein [Bombilactobacillus bombi]MBA1434621.1 cytochrome B5 [Bombilactobacillus bombi]
MEKTFTKAQLSQYNGQDKPEKYVAIDGIVYDLTNVKAWAGDNHHSHVAGNDFSNEILQAPHKKTVLEKLPVVGKLVD